MIFVTDEAGQCVYASGEWADLTGQQVGHAMGRGWLERVHPDDRTIVVETIDTALASAAEFSVRYRLLGPSGTPRWVGAGGVPSFGISDHRFIGYLGSITEIAGTATDIVGAYGNVEHFVPPTPHSNTMPSCKLDLVADHLILAHSLIEQDGGKEALPFLRQALFTVGRALAARTPDLRRSLN